MAIGEVIKSSKVNFIGYMDHVTGTGGLAEMVKTCLNFQMVFMYVAYRLTKR